MASVCRPRGGGAEPARSPLNPPLQSIVSRHWEFYMEHLGIVFNSANTLKVDRPTGCIKRKVFTSCNGILAHSKSVDEFVKLSLVKSYCLPLLSYCTGVLDFTGQQVQEIAVCWNDCFVVFLLLKGTSRSNCYATFIVTSYHLNLCTTCSSGSS